MKLLEKEKNIKYLFEFFNEHDNEILKVIFENKIIKNARLDTMYENEDEDDEYNVILMKNLDDNSLFEISYKNVPSKIIFKGNNIIK